MFIGYLLYFRHYAMPRELSQNKAEAAPSGFCSHCLTLLLGIQDTPLRVVLCLSSLCFLRWLFCFCFTFIGCPQSSALFSPDILPEQSQYTSISLFHLFNTIIYIDYCIIMDYYAYMDYI